MLGILLQAIAFAWIWGDRPGPRSSPTLTVSSRGMLALVALIVAAASFWLVLASMRTLGRQWSLAARTIAQHELITGGPYGIVRHPIYVGMYGVLLAIGLALGSVRAIVGATVLYGLGTYVRAQAEDALMAATFGEAFEAYRRRVPALLPRPGAQARARR